MNGDTQRAWLIPSAPQPYEVPATPPRWIIDSERYDPDAGDPDLRIYSGDVNGDGVEDVVVAFPAESGEI